MACFKIFHKKKVVPSPPPPPLPLPLVSTSPWRQFETEQKRKTHHPSYATVYSEDDIIALEERYSAAKPSLRTSSTVSDKESAVLEESIKKMVHFSEFVSEAYIQPRY